MPIETSSRMWKSAEAIEESTIEEVLEYLEAHDGQAFHVRELSDEFLGTEWDIAHEKEREIQRIGEDEFYNRLDSGEYDEKYETDLAAATEDKRKTSRMFSFLDLLQDRGKVEVRLVPQEDTDIPYEEIGEVAYFTFSG